MNPRSLCLTIVWLLMPALVVSAQARLEIPSREAMIQFAANGPSVDVEPLTAELQQAAVAAAKDLVKEAPPDEIARCVVISCTPAEDGMRVLVQFYPAGSTKAAGLQSPVVAQLLGRVIEQTPKAVKKLVEARQGARLAAVRDGLTKARQRLEDARSRLQGVTDQLRKATGLIEVSPAILRQRIAELESERQRLVFDHDAIAARRTALQAAVTSAGKRAEESALADPVLKELQQVLASRTRELDDLKHLAPPAAASPQDLLRAQAAQADARVRMLERKDEITRQAGGAALAELNNELLDCTVKGAEVEARVKSVLAAVARLSESTGLIEQAEDVARELEINRGAVGAAQERVLDVELRISFAEMPRVYVE